MKRIAKWTALVALSLALAANVLVVWRAGPGGASPAPADCALVLGAGLDPWGQPSPVLRDRLDEARALYARGEVQRILVSGDHGTPGYDEPGAMRDYLVGQGVPATAITLDHAGFDTYSSVWRARHVFGARRVVVVTQAFHLSRAVFLARALGLDAEGSAADRRVYRGIVWLELRETLSRPKALVDVVRGRRPRYPGPAEPMPRES